jgi:hypothetical protein
MSRVLDMSTEERRAWIYIVVAVVVPVVYFAVVLGSGVDYVVPLITAVVVAVVANIVLTVVAAVLRPEESGPKDERDRQIDRAANGVAFFVMSIAALVPLVLAMARVDQFWIAQALYLAFVLSALAAAITRIVGYRRGV